MDTIMLYILGVIIFIALIAVYAFVMRTLLPKLLRVKYCIQKSNDRGIHKYVYEGGRAITYEPHPSFRKYVNAYSLFTNNGYKYVRCKLDEAITKIRYTVTTFDRHDKVIDVVSVNEKISKRGQTSPVLLHHKTSYVCLQVLSVNGADYTRQPLVRIKNANIAVYVISAIAVTFAAMAAFATGLRIFIEDVMDMSIPLSFDALYFVIPAIATGLVYSIAVIRSARRKV